MMFYGIWTSNTANGSMAVHTSLLPVHQVFGQSPNCAKPFKPFFDLEPLELKAAQGRFLIVLWTRCTASSFPKRIIGSSTLTTPISNLDKPTSSVSFN